MSVKKPPEKVAFQATTATGRATVLITRMPTGQIRFEARTSGSTWFMIDQDDLLTVLVRWV